MEMNHFFTGKWPLGSPDKPVEFFRRHAVSESSTGGGRRVWTTARNIVSGAGWNLHFSLQRHLRAAGYELKVRPLTASTCRRGEPDIWADPWQKAVWLRAVAVGTSQLPAAASSPAWAPDYGGLLSGSAPRCAGGPARAVNMVMNKGGQGLPGSSYPSYHCHAVQHDGSVPADVTWWICVTGIVNV